METWIRIASYADSSGPYFIDVNAGLTLMRTGYGPDGGDAVVQHMTRAPQHDGTDELTHMTDRFSLGEQVDDGDIVIIDGAAYVVGDVVEACTICGDHDHTTAGHATTLDAIPTDMDTEA